ncbi:sugar phosphate isomerase/epimerase [Glutamicibacter ectropisis]|uniref:Sugar phosphate isomerase/epimerase n=1 Tax=Glutamicibacter ectropisis TaxID=3046593 RepID=A0AAU6WDZ4_9MICC
MEIGLITDSLSSRSLEEVLGIAADLGLSSLELPTGNWSEAPHLNLDALLEDDAERQAFMAKIAGAGLGISALNANGNQLHPVSGAEQGAVLRKTIRLAQLMEVPTVVCMSGLPGAAGDSSPNWVTSSWPPENLAILEYQWEQVALPYWRDLAAFAEEHNVKLAIEPCFTQLVYNAATAKRLIDSVGSTWVGINLDPSHLMAMGADIPSVIRALAGTIMHVHAKDVRLNATVAAANGLPDGTAMTQWQQRAWNYVTLGLGHPGGEAFWADFVYELRAAGYDGTLNIEHEDVLVNSEEGVRRAAGLLRKVALQGAPDWTPAQV